MEYEESSLNADTSALSPSKDNGEIDPTILDYFQQHDFQVKIGDEYISHEYSHVIRVTAIYIKPNPYHKDEAGTMWVGYDYLHGGWGSDKKGSGDLKDFTPKDDGDCKWHKLYASFDQVKQDALMSLANGDKPLEDTTNKTETGLTVTSGSSAIKAANRQLRDEQNRLAVMKQTIELLMGNIRSQISDMRKQIAYTSKILRLLETFMGVYEKIITFKDGELSPIDTPITIRQLVLYADEEMAVIDAKDGQRGIDYRRLDEFDQWVSRNYLQLVPEEKCVVAIKPTRQRRDYGNIFANADANAANNMVYLLIRNGERLYRVFTSLYMDDKLFPSFEEMEKVNAMLMSDREYDTTNHFYSKDKAKDEDLYWKQNAVLLQGLIMRTEVFQPTPFPISLFETRSYDTGMLSLIRDAEPTLTDGRPSFKKWRKSLNEKIKTGTRVVMGYYEGYNSKDSGHDHFRGNYSNYFPSLPNQGVYVVDEAKMEVKEWDSSIRDEHPPFTDTGKFEHHVKHINHLRFLYTPSDTIAAIDEEGYFEFRTRNKRVAFYFDSDDDFFMNYDDVTLDEVEYYLNNRLERRNYLSVMPLLIEIRNERRREHEHELPLVKMIAAEFNCNESVVWRCVEWWKMKTNLHRWIEEDDAKAWRMIRRELKKVRDHQEYVSNSEEM